MNAVTTTQQATSGNRPAIISGLPRNTLSIMKMHLERQSGELRLPATEMPTGELRSRMIERAKILRACLQSAGADAVKPEIVAIFATMGSRGGTATDAELVQRIYAEDLAGLPLFAVRMACADFRQKRAGDGRWAPSQGDIRERALHHAKDFSKELADLGDLLRAKPLQVEGPRPQTAEERAAAVARVRKHRDAVVQAADPAPPRSSNLQKPRDVREEAEARRTADANLDQMKTDGFTPKLAPHLFERFAPR